MRVRKAAPKAFRWIVFACGTLLALSFLFLFAPAIASALRHTPPRLPADRRWEGQVMIAMSLVFLLGYGIGWWRALWGGLIMMVAAMLVSVPFILQGNYGTLFFGLPQLIVGALYVALSRSGTPPSG